MKSSIGLLYILLACCSVACNAPNAFKGKHQIIDQFPKHISLEAEELEINAPGIVNLSIVDTILLANFHQNPDMLMAGYGLNGLKPLGPLIRRGKGPNDFLHVRVPLQFSMDSESIKAWGFDSQLYCFHLLNITRTIDQQQTVIDKRYNLRTPVIALN